MKTVCISDTHTRHKEILLPEGELIIHAGDMGSIGSKCEIEDFLIWYSGLDYKYKILIGGNHDRYLEFEDASIIRAMIPENIHYLNDSGITIEGIHFWGSPVQPAFNNWAFNRERGEDIDRHWQLIPDDTDVLITHGPPFGILDKTVREDHVGCEKLLEKVQKIKPKFHIFGHVHEGYGIHHQRGTRFINASILNERYRYTNDPIIIDL
jgi:Icc-related predicted phosphoesterase